MNKNHLKIITAGMLSTSLLGVTTPAIALETPKPITKTVDKEERYIVTYEENVDVDKKSNELKGKGAEVGETFKHSIKGAAITVSASEAAVIENMPGVAAIEVDEYIKVADTQQSAPWGVDRTDQRALPLNGTFTTEAEAGKGVDVYVVDSGILPTHVDFGGRVAQGWSVVNDGTGVLDCNGHGTHVAGTAAGTKYGVAKSATIIPVRVFDCSGGGYTSDVIKGLDWVKANHQAGTPAVVNLSLGGSSSLAMDSAIKSTIADGITATVAAGNEAVDACGLSPARTPEAITVAATDRTDTQSSFSNFGSCVDLYAPGSSITSAVHTSNTATAVYSGTSMATPHVAGAAAVILSRNPALTPAQVSAEILSTSTTGIVKNATAGTPNRLLFLSSTTGEPAPTPTPAPASAPSAPTNVVASPGDAAGEANVQWTSSVDNGSAIIDQDMFIYENGVKTYQVGIPAEYNNVTINGLPEGHTYTFTMASTNAVGTSPESAQSQPVTIPSAATAPAAPSNVQASPLVAGATIEWTLGADNGSALTSQTVKAYEGDVLVKSIDVSGTDTTINMGDLEQGKTYTFAVTATNAVGTSAESARSNPVTTQFDATAPDAPYDVSATVGPDAGSATINWTQGSDNLSALTKQTINVYQNGILSHSVDVPPTDSSATLYDLAEGATYTFSVTATNTVGTSTESAQTNAVTTKVAPKAPSAPTNARAYAGVGSASVYWNAAADNGSAITSQEITVYNGVNIVKTVTVPASYKGVVISGLYSGTYYHFTVKTVNSVGTSPESAVSNRVTPTAKAPAVATSVWAYAKDNAATLYWKKGSENGAPLTQQIVTVYSGTTKIGIIRLSGTPSSVKITGLTQGRSYNFTVTEVNNIGSSPASVKSNAVTPF